MVEEEAEGLSLEENKELYFRRVSLGAPRAQPIIADFFSTSVFASCCVSPRPALPRPSKDLPEEESLARERPSLVAALCARMTPPGGMNLPC